MASERRRTLCAWILALSCAAPAAARAEASAADRETARALMKEGDRLLREKDAAQALRAYRGAHDIMNVPSTGIGVVRALTELGRLVEARDVALQVVRIPVAGNEAAALKVAREEAAKAARELEPRIAGLLVTVQGANIVIDGVALPEGAAGLTRKVDPGRHEIVVTAPGYRQAKLTVTLAEGETRELRPELEPLAEEPEKPVPARPAPKPKPAVEVARASPETQDESTTLADVLLIGGASTAVVGITVGSIAGIMAIQRSSDLRASCPSSGCPPERQEDYDSAHRLATVSNVAFVAGAVGLGVGAYGYYLLTSRSAPAPAGAAVWPVAGVGYAGVLGQF